MRGIAFKIIALSIFAVVISACSSSSSTTPSDPSAISENAGAMVAAAFSSSGSASISSTLVKRIALNAIRHQSIPGTCDSLSGGPENVDSSAQGESGTYGAAADSVTVDADADFCQDSDGNDVSDAEEAKFASFTVSAATTSCSDGTSATMAGSGVWRQLPDDDFCPEIYGNFTITIDEEEGNANCTIRLSCSGGEDSDSSVVVEATCSDDEGETIELTDDVTCEIDAG